MLNRTVDYMNINSTRRIRGWLL